MDIFVFFVNLLQYIHIIFVWLNYNLLAIDLFLSDCSIIMVLFFVIIVLFFVAYYGLLWVIFWLMYWSGILCNSLCYKCLRVFSVVVYVWYYGHCIWYYGIIVLYMHVCYNGIIVMLLWCICIILYVYEYGCIYVVMCGYMVVYYRCGTCVVLCEIVML